MKKIILNQLLVFCLLTNTVFQKSLASDHVGAAVDNENSDSAYSKVHASDTSIVDRTIKEMNESMLRVLILAYTFDKFSKEKALTIQTGYDPKSYESFINTLIGSTAIEVIAASIIFSYGAGSTGKPNDELSSNALLGGSSVIPSAILLFGAASTASYFEPASEKRWSEVPEKIRNDQAYDEMITKKIQPYISYLNLSVDKTNRLKTAIKNALVESYRKGLRSQDEGSKVEVQISIMDILNEIDPENSLTYKNANEIFELLEKNYKPDYKPTPKELLFANIELAKDLSSKLNNISTDDNNLLSDTQKNDLKAALNKLDKQIKFADRIKNRNS